MKHAYDIYEDGDITWLLTLVVTTENPVNQSDINYLNDLVSDEYNCKVAQDDKRTKIVVYDIDSRELDSVFYTLVEFFDGITPVVK